MPAKRITMRKIRDVIRLHFGAKLSIRDINRSTKVSVGGIHRLIEKTKEKGLGWPLPVHLDDDAALATLFYPAADPRPSKKFAQPDWASIHQELKKKGVTRQLLWEEYTQQYPNRCYSLTQFYARYKQWLKKQKRSMRQTHKAGEKLFVDYAGQTVPIVCATTGEVRSAQIFVAVMGASSYTFAEATWSQGLKDWLQSHVRAFEFYGGLSTMVIPDNLRSGVSKACRYDPELNPSYQQLADHYHIAVIPARPYRPKDKAKAEVGVQVIERWILARLRHHIFFSLAELNTCIRKLLEDVNNRPFKRLPGSRREWFEKLDKPALKPLPKHPYEYTDIKPATVNVDYHIEYDHHCYSVPHQLVGERVDIHAQDRLIQIYFKNQRITSHVRKYHPGMTTESTHMPEKHAKHLKWTPGRLMNWAQQLGPETRQWVKAQLQRKAHPEQAYRVCLGLLSLSRKYPAERIDKACSIANEKGLTKLKHIKTILESNQDKLVQTSSWQLSLLPQDHENIRGPESFH